MEDQALSSLVSMGNHFPYFNMITSAVVDEKAQLTCMRQFYIGATAKEYFGLQDERLISKIYLKPEIADENVMHLFVGFAANNASGYLVTPELVTETTMARYGFALNESTNIYGISCSGAATEVTSNHDLVNTNINVVLTVVYDIGVQAEFFVNGTSIGILDTNLAESLTFGFQFQLYIQTREAFNKNLRLYLTDLRWQNGVSF